MADCCAVPEEQDGGDLRFRRVLWIALAANVGMFAIEIVAGLLAGSMALQADAIDFFGDAANYGVSLWVAGMGLAARARAALVKSATQAAFGRWVRAGAGDKAIAGGVPLAGVMGATGVLALAVNVAVAGLLFRYRGGDANMRSIWLCSRNDAIGNVAVLLAASGVAATATGWPDLGVAALIAALNLRAAAQVLRQALAERARARALPTAAG